MHPPIFYEFQRKESSSDGRSVYDFLGGAIDASYKHGWEKNVQPAGIKLKPGYPAPSEWTIDWIACLLAAKLAGERFTVIELGAGYGQWMVSAIMAYKSLHPDRPAHGMALEADVTHFEWLEQHVAKNIGGYPDVETDLLYAAAGYDGTARFPILSEPDRDYGAAYQTNRASENMHEVRCFSMDSINQRFGEQCVDLLHVDIQGAEQDLMVNPGFESVLRKTRFALFGTHKSDALHDSLSKQCESAGLKIHINWPRNSSVKSQFGEVETNDGAILCSAESLCEQTKFWLSHQAAKKKLC